MKIKDYKCKCGCDDFFFMNKGVQVGIYCTLCGKWYKWADKDEQNLKNNVPEKKSRNEEGEFIEMTEIIIKGDDFNTSWENVPQEVADAVKTLLYAVEENLGNPMISRITKIGEE
jgi:hypothetical protein